MITISIAVTGMTCEHCVAAVTGELSEVAGVRRVDVDLRTGNVELLTDFASHPNVLRAAVENAGYRLAVPIAG